jgi:Glycosyl transferase family 11
MFQFAFGIYYAYSKNVKLKLDATYLLAKYKSKQRIYRTYDLDIFVNQIEIASGKEILRYVIPRMDNKYLFYFLNQLYRRKEVYFERKPFHFDESILTNGENAYFAGHWQSYKYFDEIKDLIKNVFTFKYPLLPESQELFNEINASNSICLNYRRADYLTDPQLNTLSGQSGINYYKKAMDLISTKINNPVYFVFSDDIDWCRKNVATGYKTVFVNHEHAGMKYSNYLRLMSSCKNFIIPNSTFGWWAAWLGESEEKTVIVPEQWTNKVKLGDCDLVPQSWIKIQ